MLPQRPPNPVHPQGPSRAPPHSLSRWTLRRARLPALHRTLLPKQEKHQTELARTGVATKNLLPYLNPKPQTLNP